MADGILRIAVTSMSHAVKAVTTERGLDAGAFTMVVYGGAGPLHASAIARELGIRRVLIPFSPGHFSAFGMLFSDLRYDYVRSCFRRLDEASFDELEAMYGDMEKEGRMAIADSAVKPSEIRLAYAADMRYVGQEHAVSVDLPLALIRAKDRAAIKTEFDKVHAVRYGTSAPGEPADLVSLRMTVSGLMQKPSPRQVPEGAKAPDKEAVLRTKDVYFRDAKGFVETPVYARTKLRGGNEITGPALIEEHASTTVLQPGDALTVDVFGNLLVSIGA
jgi:N-methylhydantoinase A